MGAPPIGIPPTGGGPASIGPAPAIISPPTPCPISVGAPSGVTISAPEAKSSTNIPIPLSTSGIAIIIPGCAKANTESGVLDASSGPTIIANSSYRD